MTKGNKHINDADFIRYMADEMTLAERNAFEKEMQKQAFDAEALEGYEAASSVNIHNDLNELKQRIQQKHKKNRTPYFAAAATILLLIASGVIWMQVNHNNPLPKVSEVKTEKIAEEKAIIPPAEKAIVPAPISEDNILIEEKELITLNYEDVEKTNETIIASKPVDKTTASENLPKDNLQAKRATIQAAPEYKLPIKLNEKETVIEAIALMDSEEEVLDIEFENKHIIQGRVISSDNKEPLPGVTIVEKGTQNGIVSDIDGYFKIEITKDSGSNLIASFIGMETQEIPATRDSALRIEMNQENLALNEVVVVGYGTQRKKSATGSTTHVSNTTEYKKAHPVCDMKEYKTYLNENAILPVNYSKNKVIVKVLLTIDKKGTITTIKNSNDTDDEIFELAKELIFKAPDWNPSLENGNPVNSEISLRIVFQKKNN